MYGRDAVADCNTTGNWETPLVVYYSCEGVWNIHFTYLLTVVVVVGTI